MIRKSAGPNFCWGAPLRLKGEIMGKFIVVALSMLVFGSSFAQDSTPGAGFAAIPGQKGGQDVFGAYDVPPHLIKDLLSTRV